MTTNFILPAICSTTQRTYKNTKITSYNRL